MTQKHKSSNWEITKAAVVGRNAIVELKSIGPSPTLAFDKNCPEFAKALTAFLGSASVARYQAMRNSLIDALGERDLASRAVVAAEQAVSDGSDPSGQELAIAMGGYAVAKRRCEILQESVHHAWRQLEIEFSQLSDRTSNAVHASVQAAINERHRDLAEVCSAILSELRVLTDRRDRGSKASLNFNDLGLAAPPAESPRRMSEVALSNG